MFGADQVAREGAGGAPLAERADRFGRFEAGLQTGFVPPAAELAGELRRFKIVAVEGGPHVDAEMMQDAGQGGGTGAVKPHHRDAPIGWRLHRVTNPAAEG